MLIAAAVAVIAGVIVFETARALSVFAQKLALEQQFREKYRRAKNFAGGLRAERLAALASLLGGHFRKMRWKEFQRMVAQIQKNLTILGATCDGLDPFTVIGYQLMAGISAIFLAAVLLSIYNPLLLALVAAGGFAVPFFLLRDKARARQNAILRHLPDVLDLYALMVGAGLDFSAATDRIVDSESGPLVEELRAVQQEIRLGKPRAAALESMAERIDLAPLSSAVGSLVIALKTGGSLASSLRALADQFRSETAQRAEKMAGEAPVKLMGPLILLIFPTIFIIIFGPVLLSFMGSGGW